MSLRLLSPSPYHNLWRDILGKAPSATSSSCCPCLKAASLSQFQPTLPSLDNCRASEWSPSFHPLPFLILLHSCQTHLSQAKLDLISSQHRKLVAPRCLPEERPTTLAWHPQVAWNLPSQSRPCQPVSGPGLLSPPDPLATPAPPPTPRLSLPCPQLVMRSLLTHSHIC